MSQVRYFVIATFHHHEHVCREMRCNLVCIYSCVFLVRCCSLFITLAQTKHVSLSWNKWFDKSSQFIFLMCTRQWSWWIWAQTMLQPIDVLNLPKIRLNSFDFLLVSIRKWRRISINFSDIIACKSWWRVEKRPFSSRITLGKFSYCRWPSLWDHEMSTDPGS